MITVNQQVKSTKYGLGIIAKIITKSTGYVEVDFNGNVRKEMAFNLTDIDSNSLKAKPVKKELTADQKAKLDRSHAAFRANMHKAQLNEYFTESQIATGNYNSDFISQ